MVNDKNVLSAAKFVNRSHGMQPAAIRYYEYQCLGCKAKTRMEDKRDDLRYELTGKHQCNCRRSDLDKPYSLRMIEIDERNQQAMKVLI